MSVAPVKARLNRLALAFSTLALIATAQAQTLAANEADLAALESGDKDLLYYFNKGELLRNKGAFEPSREAWLAADTQVRAWEEDVKVNGAKILGDIGSFILNDTTRRYDGRDYEKVFVNVRIALDHLALGDWNAARTEIKKMHEREAIIAEFRSKELEAAKGAAEAKGIKTTSFKELNGYPIETLEAPEVQALKNSYESAYANYLAGFVYEALGEPSLAAAGYRKANEMRPGDPVLEDSLKGLDARAKKSRAKKDQVDVLILVESGNAPKIDSVTLPIPLPIISKGGVSMVMTPISWPVIRPNDNSVVPATVTVNDKDLPLSLLTSTDLMARRALSDEMPGIIFRSGVRAIAKGVAQKAVQDNAGSLGVFGAVLSVAASAVAVATEKADTRSWNTLPGFYSVTRTTLPAGSHKISVRTNLGIETRDVQLSGPYAVVALRTGNGLALAQTPYVAAPTVTIADPVPAETPAAPAKEGKKKKG